MIRIRDTLGGEVIWFHYVESSEDLREVRDFVRSRKLLALDTESTGLNCYQPGWQLRTLQISNATDSFIIPARYKCTIAWIMQWPGNWIGHNGPHDIRCIDAHLGYETGVVCAGETYIPAHHYDSRGKEEGGSGHKLELLAIAHVAKDAGKWDTARKAAFKEILIEMPGEVYKSGPKKGQQKYRKAKLSEGWALINPKHPAMITYAGGDPILTYRVWQWERSIVREFRKLYDFDHRLQIACDRLQRRAILLDVHYTERLSQAYEKKAAEFKDRASEYGCRNIQSNDQIAQVLLKLKAKLVSVTATGKYKVDQNVLRKLMDDPNRSKQVWDFIHCVLLAKQLTKRRTTYTEAMLAERDEFDRVHPSINSLAARTARMSVSSPPLQQLPTKDHEDELMWESEE